MTLGGKHMEPYPDVALIKKLRGKFLEHTVDALTKDELIDLINDRSIGVDLEGEEASELFDMIKQYASLEEGKEVEEPNNY
jgi:hypothetical protein